MNRLGFRSLYLFFILLLPNFAFSQSYHLVSDVDDTLKISNVRKLSDLFYNGLYGHQIFLGMPEFYRTWVKGNSNTISYLSRSPDILMTRLTRLLFQENEFPEGEIELRHFSDFIMFRNYKVSRVKDLLQGEHLPLILIGDDGEQDPEVFQEIMNDPSVRENHDVAAAYVHQIVGRSLPSGVIGFVTAFDLALREVEAGRFSTRNALFVGEVILDEGRRDLIFPTFKNCPKDFSYQMSDTNPSGLGPVAEQDPQLVALSLRVRDYIQAYCKKEFEQQASVELLPSPDVPEPLRFH